MPAYPTLQRIPNYPVYYAPGLRTNYFFYDGLFWVFDRGDWLSSAWYNGPWDAVDRYAVPAALLHVPVRYYRSRPVSFRTYRVDAAPPPSYQRQYSRERYPVIEQQYVIQSRNYQYQPHEPVVREVYRERRVRADGYSPPAARAARGAARTRGRAALQRRRLSRSRALGGPGFS